MLISLLFYRRVGLVYAVITLTQADWPTLQLQVARAMSYFSGFVAFIVRTFLVKPDWVRAHKL